MNSAVMAGSRAFGRSVNLSNVVARNSSTSAPPTSAIATRLAAIPSEHAAFQIGSNVARVSSLACLYREYASIGEPASSARSAESLTLRATCFFLALSDSLELTLRFEGRSEEESPSSMGVNSGWLLALRRRCCVMDELRDEPRDVTAFERTVAVVAATSESLRFILDSCCRKIETAMSLRVTERWSSSVLEAGAVGGNTTSSEPSEWSVERSRVVFGGSLNELKTNMRRMMEPGKWRTVAASSVAVMVFMYALASLREPVYVFASRTKTTAVTRRCPKRSHQEPCVLLKMSEHEGSVAGSVMVVLVMLRKRRRRMLVAPSVSRVESDEEDHEM